MDRRVTCSGPEKGNDSVCWSTAGYGSGLEAADGLQPQQTYKYSRGKTTSCLAAAAVISYFPLIDPRVSLRWSGGADVCSSAGFRFRLLSVTAEAALSRPCNQKLSGAEVKISLYCYCPQSREQREMLHLVVETGNSRR